MDKRNRGGKLTRSKTVTFRLNPKLRYGLDLAAINQRRTTSNFIEVAIERALADVFVGDIRLMDVVEKTWSAQESERLHRLAETWPELLTYEQQEKLKV
jgi:predicted DNA-binding protein